MGDETLRQSSPSDKGLNARQSKGMNKLLNRFRLVNKCGWRISDSSRFAVIRLVVTGEEPEVRALSALQRHYVWIVAHQASMQPWNELTTLEIDVPVQA
jgi:hypothetical protein